MRVVSLVPSSTETLLELGADVVGCTKFCEQPAIAHVGGTKNPDIEAIIALSPDVVVVDREENRRVDAERLEAEGVRLFVSDVTTVDDALDLVGDLAELVGADVDRPSVDQVEPLGVEVFVPIWRRPWMSINGSTYGASVLAHLGCHLVTADHDVAYPEVELDRLTAWRPDLVAVPSEPYVFSEAHLAELQAAAPRSRVVRVDGQDLFWWGSRTPGSIHRLHSALSLAASSLSR